MFKQIVIPKPLRFDLTHVSNNQLICHYIHYSLFDLLSEGPQRILQLPVAKSMSLQLDAEVRSLSTSVTSHQNEDDIGFCDMVMKR